MRGRGMKKGLFLPGPGSEAYLPSPDRRHNAVEHPVTKIAAGMALEATGHSAEIVLQRAIVIAVSFYSRSHRPFR